MFKRRLKNGNSCIFYLDSFFHNTFLLVTPFSVIYICEDFDTKHNWISSVVLVVITWTCGRQGYVSPLKHLIPLVFR